MGGSNEDRSLGRFFFERFKGTILALSKNSLDAISDGVSISYPLDEISFFRLIRGLSNTEHRFFDKINIEQTVRTSVFETLS